MRLTKYHGLGNDFIIGHYNDLKDHNLPQLAKTYCHRHTGIGADGLIIVKEHPLEMVYYNSDGSKAAMCGNGIRCFMAYSLDEGIVQEDVVSVKTLAGLYTLTVTQKDPLQITVDMGKANYNPTSFGVERQEPLLNQTLNIFKEDITYSGLLMGVPHIAVERKSLDTKEMTKLGSLLTQHELFTEGTNVNFYTVTSRDHIRMQTYERGAGLTLACGTGACATVAVLHKLNVLENHVTVTLPLGNLTIEITNNDHVIMTGPAEKIADIIVAERSQNDVKRITRCDCYAI